MLLESVPLDTFGACNGNGSVHSFSRGKIGVGCTNVGGTSKMLVTTTFPSKRVVSDPNLID
jgi:hypothetical protein